MAVSSVTALCLSTRNGVSTRGQQRCNGLDGRSTYLNGINGTCKQLSVGIAYEAGVSLNKLSPRMSPAVKLIDITSSSFYAIDNICTAADGDLPQPAPHKDSNVIAEGSHSGKREREDDERNDTKASAMQENISPPHLMQMVYKEDASTDELCFGKRKRRRASLAQPPQGSQLSESSLAESVCGQLKSSTSTATLAESSICDGTEGSSSTSDVESSSQSAAGGAGVANDQEDSDSHTVPCSWDGCEVKLMSPALADHLRQCHVDAQVDGEFVACLWHGCKVYQQRSRSRVWLETHVLRHAGNKPFLCIVDGCGQRFASRRLLERHVNAHLNRMSQQQQACPKLLKNRDEARLKLLKRKKLQVARPWAAKVADYFDSCTMEHLCSQIVHMHAASGIDMEKSLKRVTFRSEVVAKRCTESGESEVLLKWTPENVLADEWVAEGQRQRRKQHTCALSEVPAHSVSSVHPALYRQHRFRKQRRK